MTDSVERFGEMLVKSVRDDAIEWVLAEASHGKSAQAKAWATLFEDRLDGKGFEQIATDIVDITIGSLLRAIDQGELPLSVRVDERDVDLAEEGESMLVGGYVADWRGRYSSKLVTDYLADLR